MSRLKYVNCRTWDTTTNQFKFPEYNDSEFKQDYLSDRPNVGVAFSGGGTRSASATLGQLRGLDSLGLLENIRYLSCVSGGSWTCVPFTYLSPHIPDETFLGEMVEPRDVTQKYLKDLDKNSFAYAISNTLISDDFIEHAIRFGGDETYSRAIGETFLEPADVGSRKRFFTMNDQSISAIIKRNRNMRNEDFYTVQSGRPYLIACATLLRQNNPPPRPKKIHFEFTPLYVGAHVRHLEAGSRGQEIGGGYVEPFGFDSDAPEKESSTGVLTVRLGRTKHRLTLSDVVGTSGAAPAEILDKIGLDFLGFPEFKHWPVNNATAARAKEYEFGDGGHLENLGIMPLLKRQVKRIVVFINTKSRLQVTGNSVKINSAIPPLFGKGNDPTKPNQVFPESDYQDLADGLWKAKQDGRTVMHRKEYQVQSNDHYGVVGGWSVTVLWVYNERVPEWEKMLPKSIREMVGSGALGNFPHYLTFFQNPPTIIDLSALQVSTLAHLSCWNVVSNESEFKEMLG